MTRVLAGGLGPLTRGAAEVLYVAVVLSLVVLAGSLLAVAAVRRRRATKARRGPAVIAPTVPTVPTTATVPDLPSLPQPRGKHARPAVQESPDVPGQLVPARPAVAARHAARPPGRHRKPA